MNYISIKPLCKTNKSHKSIVSEGSLGGKFFPLGGPACGQVVTAPHYVSFSTGTCIVLTDNSCQPQREWPKMEWGENCNTQDSLILEPSELHRWLRSALLSAQWLTKGENSKGGDPLKPVEVWLALPCRKLSLWTGAVSIRCLVDVNPGGKY